MPTVRNATLEDAASIAEIYNAGIIERVATFETRLREASEITTWLEGKHPVVVVCNEENKVQGFASCSGYRPRDCYQHIAEFSVYIAASSRGQGLGRLAMERLIEKAAEQGFMKLVSRIFVENQASRKLMTSLGFREVGEYHRHGQLDGEWRDVVIVERLLGEAKP